MLVTWLIIDAGNNEPHDSRKAPYPIRYRKNRSILPRERDSQVVAVRLVVAWRLDILLLNAELWRMKISYDPEIDALYIRLLEGSTRVPFRAVVRWSCAQHRYR